jgi:hypothetical protein
MRTYYQSQGLPRLHLTSEELIGLKKRGQEIRFKLGENGQSQDYFIVYDSIGFGILTPDPSEGRSAGYLFLNKQMINRILKEKTLPVPSLRLVEGKTLEGEIGAYICHDQQSK